MARADRKLLTWLILSFQIMPLVGLDRAVAWDYQQRQQAEPTAPLQSATDLKPSTESSTSALVAYEDIVITASLRTVSGSTCQKTVTSRPCQMLLADQSSQVRTPIRRDSAAMILVRKTETIRAIADTTSWKQGASHTAWIGPAFSGCVSIDPTQSRASTRPQSQLISLRQIFQVSTKPMNRVIGASIARRTCFYLDGMEYSDQRDRLLPGSGEAFPTQPEQESFSTVSMKVHFQTPAAAVCNGTRFSWLRSSRLARPVVLLFNFQKGIAMHPANGPPMAESLISASTLLSTSRLRSLAAQPRLLPIHHIQFILSREVAL